MYNGRAMKTTSIKKLLWVTFYCFPLIAFLAHSKEPSAEIVSPDASSQKAHNVSTPVNSAPAKTILYRYRREEGQEPFRASVIPATLQSTKSTAHWVRAYVQTKAVEHGVDPKLALWIVRHESQFNPRARGDGEASRGLWQISKIYHPEVSDAVAFNVAGSTEWSLQRIRAGKANEWSTYRFCRTLYEDCPF
jgi:hypothetical protein